MYMYTEIAKCEIQVSINVISDGMFFFTKMEKHENKLEIWCKICFFLLKKIVNTFFFQIRWVE